jgi:hypothetical protein
MQQGDGIRAAGDSNAQALSGAQQIGPAEEGYEPLGELSSPRHGFSLPCFLRQACGCKTVGNSHQQVS